jgi:hypothetical protein
LNINPELTIEDIPAIQKVSLLLWMMHLLDASIHWLVWDILPELYKKRSVPASKAEFHGRK